MRPARYPARPVRNEIGERLLQRPGSALGSRSVARERSVIGEAMANLKRGGDGSNQYAKGANTSNEALAQISLKAASELLGVSTASIERVRRVEARGIPEKG